MPGIDRIEGDLIKAGGDTIVEIMHKICNKIWATGRFPEQLTQLLIVSIPNKGDMQTYLSAKINKCSFTCQNV